jgi:hypothetical protein
LQDLAKVATTNQNDNFGESNEKNKIDKFKEVFHEDSIDILL